MDAVGEQRWRDERLVGDGSDRSARMTGSALTDAVSAGARAPEPRGAAPAFIGLRLAVSGSVVAVARLYRESGGGGRTPA